MNVCTSFSPSLMKLYGDRFVESWKRHSDVPLFVFYEGGKPDLKGVELVSLDEDRDRREFIGTYGGKPYARGFVHTDNGWVCDYRAVLTGGVRAAARLAWLEAEALVLP